MALNRRERLLETAIRLFDANGYHATGIDRILAEAGVAKMTLYKHFGSKEALVLAALEERDARTLTGLRAAVEARAGNPRDRLLAIFDWLEEWFESPDFNGCLFVKAAGEYGRRDDPIHLAASKHQRDTLRYLRELADEAGAARPAQLARQLMLLFHGAVVVTQVNGPVGAGAEAARAAEVLIDQAVGTKGALAAAGTA
jgi:AcrR family transcriptional regulator